MCSGEGNPVLKSAPRSSQRITEQYGVEKELAGRLRTAGKCERMRLYSAVYDELFRRFPDHPQLALRADITAKRAAVAERIKLLSRYLRPNEVFLEIGPGDCSLAVEVARRVQRVYAVEASAEVSRAAPLPKNVELIISDDCGVPLPDGTVDVAYSDQLFEHLHPDDALEQLKNIYKALAPSGIYICITPNRLSGPHDVSRDFDDVATGLHLKEYTATELAAIFHSAGFAEVELLAGARGVHLPFPLAAVEALESLLVRSPRRVAKRLARSVPLRVLLGIKIVGRKTAICQGGEVEKARVGRS
jgi:SAM-dependent methyltransferase